MRSIREVGSDWTEGSRYEANAGEPAIAAVENLEVDPPKRLVPARRHARRAARGRDEEVYGGRPQILSGLKTLPETGEKLTTRGSLLDASS